MQTRRLGTVLWAVTLCVGLAAPVVASPYAYVANNGNNPIPGSVSVIDTATHAVIETIPMSSGYYARSATVNAAGTKVYVTAQTNGLTGIVAIVDAFTNIIQQQVVSGPFPPAGFPNETVLTPDGTRLYFAAGFSATQVMDTSTNQIIATVADSANEYTNRIAVNPAGTRIYVTHYAGGAISVIDTATNTETATIPGPAIGVAVDPSGDPVYVARSGASISLIDPSTNLETGSIPLTCGAYGMAFNPGGTTLYATCPGFNDNKLEVINTTTNTETTLVPVGEDPIGVSVTPDGSHVYVVNSANSPNPNGTVSVVDTGTNTVVDTVPAGIQAEGMGQFIGPQFTCGNGIHEPGEGCDDGNIVGGDGCDADCLVRHDTIVMPRAPLTVTIPVGKFNVTKKFGVTVKNGDLTETAGHTIKLDATSNCPSPDVLVYPPDFGAPAHVNSVLVKGGKTKTAMVTLYLTAGNPPIDTFNRKAPTRCTVTLTASTVPSLGTAERTPSNNVSTVELNLIDRNDPETTTATVHESVLKSIAPVKVTIPMTKSAASKKVHPAVVNADYLPTPEDPTQHPIAVTRTGGDCPGGAVGIVDFDSVMPLEQNSVQVKGGKTKTGSLALTIDRSVFTAAGPVSPQRCSVILSATGPTDPDPDPTNNSTTLLIDVIAK